MCMRGPFDLIKVGNTGFQIGKNRTKFFWVIIANCVWNVDHRGAGIDSSLDRFN